MEEKNLNPAPEDPPAEPAESKPKVPYIEEGSTIFTSKPEKSKPVKQKSSLMGRKLRNTILLFVLVLAMGGGITSIIIFLPKPSEGGNLPSDVSKDTFAVVSKEQSEVKSITVTNTNGSITVKPDAAATVAETSDSSGTDAITWLVDGYSDISFNSYSLSSIADSVTEIESDNRYTDAPSEEDLQQCGIAAPAVTAEVTLRDGSYKLAIGKQTPDRSGYYATCTLTDGIYIIPSSVYTSLDVKLINLVDTLMVAAPVDTSTDSVTDEYFDGGQGTLSKFDSINFSGSFYTKSFTLEYDSDDSVGFTTYKISGDAAGRSANDTKVSSILTFVGAGINASSVLEISPDKATVSKYGLDKPLKIIKYKVKDKTVTLKFAEYTDAEGDTSYYAAMVDGVPLIYKFSKENISFSDDQLNKFYSTLLFLKNIVSVSKISVTIDGTTSVFNLKHSTDEDDAAVIDVTSGGETFDDDSFRTYYQKIISFAPIEDLTETVTGTPSVKIVFSYVDGGKDDTIELTRVSDMRYAYRLNGEYLTRIESKYVKEFTDLTEEFLKNKVLPEN